MEEEPKRLNLFTKDETNVFEAEVVECPSCSFIFATRHDLQRNPGHYECPACRQIELEEMLEELADQKAFAEERLRQIIGIAIEGYK